MTRKIRSKKSGSRKSSTIRKRSRKVISRKTMRRKAINRMTNQKRSNRVKRAKRVSRYKRKNIQKGGSIVNMEDYVGEVIIYPNMSNTGDPKRDVIVKLLEINKSDKKVSFRPDNDERFQWAKTFDQINDYIKQNEIYVIDDDGQAAFFNELQ
jgi:hypothetical protein